MQTEQILELVEHSLEDKKARDIKVLDVHDKSSVTDFMVIASGTSNRHVKSVAENVMVDAKHAGLDLMGVEGLDNAEWALVDLGDVIVHVMQEPTRALYDLERLWGEDSLEEEKA